MIEAIIIVAIALILIYIVVLYKKNSKKIKSDKDKSGTKNDAKKAEDAGKGATTSGQKVEVESKIIKGTMFEEAIREAEQNGYTYQKPSAQTKVDNSRLKLDRENFVGEIQKTMEVSKIKQQSLKSHTNKIGVEGPTKAAGEAQATQQQVQKNQAEQAATKTDVSAEIKGLSPELKALLVNDMLNRKY